MGLLDTLKAGGDDANAIRMGLLSAGMSLLAPRYGTQSLGYNLSNAALQGAGGYAGYMDMLRKRQQEDLQQQLQQQQLKGAQQSYDTGTLQQKATQLGLDDANNKAAVIQGFTPEQRLAYYGGDANLTSPEYKNWQLGQRDAGFKVDQDAKERAKNEALMARTMAPLDFRLAHPELNGTAFGGTRFTPQDIDAAAEMVASGNMPIASVPAASRMLVVGKVHNLNPGWNATDVMTAANAKRYWATGAGARNLQAVVTAHSHLDTLEKAFAAQGNGNLPLVNTLLNEFATQTGHPEAKTSAAVAKIVGDEVAKAVVGGGNGAGALADREEIAKSFQTAASSPQQMASVIAHYRELMQARVSSMSDMYDQTPGMGGQGSFMSAFPIYAKILDPQGAAAAAASPGPVAAPGTSAPSALPPDIQALVNKHGGQ
jgi:hypothetical protein